MFRRVCLAALLLIPAVATAQDPKVQRLPAVPLVAHTPYFSVWSTADKPTDDWSRHWTGAIQAMCGMIRVDGTTYRVLGTAPREAPAMTMTGLEVLPTRTIYTFEQAGVQATLTFTSPTLPDDLDLLTRPVTYLDWSIKATDGKKHAVSLYFDATGEWVVNKPEQQVAWATEHIDGLEALSIGAVGTKPLNRSGDDQRIDWGRLYVASSAGGRAGVFSDTTSRSAFASGLDAPEKGDLSMPRAARERWPVLALRRGTSDLGGEPISWNLLLAYDEQESMQYFRKDLKPYWTVKHRDVSSLLQSAAKEHDAILKRCEGYDKALMAALEKAGGDDYARLCAPAFRQCLAAHGYAALPDGKLLMLSKENFSNGCIGTVDVAYPAAPFFLLFNPELLKAQVTPVLEYGQSDRWKFPFAPHDLGQYPLANGQVYGGGEKTEKDQMPVEECGNMLLLVASIVKADGNPDYAKAYWPVLTKWADYLQSKGMDPENQLCTDDFAGHLAHNTNLSLKAIVALGAYAQMAEALGRKDEAESHRKAAKEMAGRWAKMADDGDHYRLAFDKPGTWSQKYNLVWDQLLGLDLFPPEVKRKEIAFYLTKQNKFGLPLDNRSLYTKIDWIVWTATMADSRKDFEAFISPLVKFLRESPSRVPMTDWYWTNDGRKEGFQARSVVGGLYIKMLSEQKLGNVWHSKGSD